MQTVLITGATGNIGSVVVRLLADSDVSVRAMTRSPERVGWSENLDVEVVKGDFMAPETLDNALTGTDQAFLLSPNVKHMAEMQSNFVAAAERADITHLVKLSAAGADPDTSWDIARWHGRVEQEIAASSLDYTFIRPVSYMQNLLNDAETIRSEGQFGRATPADAKINVVDTRDVARLVATVLRNNEHRGAVYKPTGPEPITFEAMAQALTEATGTEVAFRELAPSEAKRAIINDGGPEWLADAMVGLQVAFGDGLADLNTNDVHRVTGEPPGSFATFARDHAEVFTPN
ncbi:SDR family oxidoreductase [Haloarcula litorea]|uniref:SDR family oxidoreductase n=1 Tax=Haloarcula litorea TaxID=3032579 RepID=UPI0023E87ACD|nr:SDR family oxidoreductase [Halomicroarcula sp. GDY20]